VGAGRLAQAAAASATRTSEGRMVNKNMRYLFGDVKIAVMMRRHKYPAQRQKGM
jgi:hypothetical protein